MYIYASGDLIFLKSRIFQKATEMCAFRWRLGVIKMIRIRERPKKDSTPKTDDKKRKGSSEDQSKSSMFTGTGHTLKPK